ncbi:SDR family oxidoreductase [Natrinema halophilum]|uniref:SDR family oxidoreductase n=2 Tax=Natrinema halophilum TaxID=1699371 RepID=A0A7D5GST4_9EURY|nr:SDR family oxidoreductase [Natrinema halophilum]QLG49549.1 SDR family oxidoreductase [Natrinema halophilum]
MIDGPDLTGQTAFITGTTRGIGKQLALALAEQGCNIVSTGKTVDDSESDLDGTIHKTADACAEKGVDTHAVQLNVRNEAEIDAAIEDAIDELGEINIVINNASAIQMQSVEEMPANRYDLVNEVNVRGTYLVSRGFIDHLKGVEEDAWILTNAPPAKVDRAPGSAAYSWSKMGMSFVTLSLADELDDHDIGCNSFWPVTAIDTRATRYFGMGTEDDWRTPEIVSDSVLEILDRDPAEFTGNVVYDEDILRDAGIEDFSRYNLTDGDPAPLSAQIFDPDYSRPEDGDET